MKFMTVLRNTFSKKQKVETLMEVRKNLVYTGEYEVRYWSVTCQSDGFRSKVYLKMTWFQAVEYLERIPHRASIASCNEDEISFARTYGFPIYEYGVPTWDAIMAL